MISIRLYQQKGKKHVRSDGKAQVYFVLARGSERKFIGSQKFIDTEFFDNEKGIVKKGDDNSIKLNAYFKRKMTDLDNIIIDLENNGKEVTFEKIEQIFTNKYTKDFIAWSFEQLKLLNGILATATLDGYRDRLKELKKYVPELPFSSLNIDFLTRYKHYLANIKGRKVNGYYQDFAVIKKFAGMAVRQGEMKNNPFDDFDLDTEETVRNWHPKEELHQLYSLLKMEGLTPEILKVVTVKLQEDLEKPLEPKIKRHLKWISKIKAIPDSLRYNLAHYMFSCVSGLRLSDKREFGEQNIVNDRISVKTSKTGKPILIPFNDMARELLPMVLDRRLKIKKDKVNTELRVCMMLIGIDKHISFHCSRHTFAINCILAGIDIITVRDWLGHRSVTTTEIYAKIAERYKDENMKKLNTFMAIAS